MSYTKRPELVIEGGLVVELDSGELVFVQQQVKTLTESLCPSIFVSATWIDEQLQPVVDNQGRHKARVEFRHAASQYEQDVLGLPALVRECLWLVLGEPLSLAPPPDPPSENPQLNATTLIPWANELVRSVDIRRAIAIAKQGVEVDLDQVL